MLILNLKGTCIFKCTYNMHWPSSSLVLVAQSSLTLCNPMDCSPPGSSVHGIIQAKILEWIVIPFFRDSSWTSDWSQVSCIAGKFFNVWATKETPIVKQYSNSMKFLFT